MLSFLALLFFAAIRPEAQIRGVLALQQEAWNRGDIQGFMAGYENSAETTMIGRSVLTGYQAILDNYRKRYPGKAGMGYLRFDDIKVRLVEADVAIATGRYTVKRDAAHGGEVTGRFTLILRRKHDDWKILHDHTS
ncbi:MAG TPA: nuclear transport factor 2 family protein [Bryobacteraceae bacterium]|nr:nuclear transport factor 2 family protein [Bryobacteraceae bacterium]